MRLALDAFAASTPLDVLADAAAAVVAAARDVRLTLVGEPQALEAALSKVPDRARDRIVVFPASQKVAEDEDPETALRLRPDASIARCWQLLAERKVEGLISLAPLPVMVAAGLRLRRLLPFVRRPAAAATIQTARGSWLILDAGAFLDAKPAHLYQYGVEGLVLHRLLTGHERGCCALLRCPDAEITREADRLLEAGLSPQQYAGIVEPADAFRSSGDVLVCPGKLGALLMRTGGSVARLLQEAELPGPRVSAALPLLGFAGYAVHLSNPAGLSEAVGLAQRMESARINDEIASQLQFGPLVGAAEEDG